MRLPNSTTTASSGDFLEKGKTTIKFYRSDYLVYVKPSNWISKMLLKLCSYTTSVEKVRTELSELPKRGLGEVEVTLELKHDLPKNHPLAPAVKTINKKRSKK